MQAGRSHWRALVAACAAVLACAVAAGCSAGGAALGPASPSRPAVSSPAAGASGGAGSPADPPTTGSVAAACVAQVLDGLTLAQRVGQLFLVGVSDDIAGPQIDAAEKAYHFGSLLLTVSTAGTSALAGQTVAMQSLAPSATGGVRFFIAANQEGGQIQQLTGPGFAVMPSALTQGSWGTGTLKQTAAIWGTQLRAAGVNLDLAPVMDVVPAGTAASNAPIGALEREFGSDPAGNGAHGAAFIAGMAEAGVATAAKHFPGLGRVRGNTDFTADVTDDVTSASDPALNSFRGAIGAGVPMVMVALATYTRIDPSRLAVFSPVVMRLLRGQFGFTGVIVSDDLGEARAVAAIPAGARAIDFLAAGGDLVTSQALAPAEDMAAAVLARARQDGGFRATVTDAARRVLAAKRAAGLLPC